MSVCHHCNPLGGLMYSLRNKLMRKAIFAVICQFCVYTSWDSPIERQMEELIINTD